MLIKKVFSQILVINYYWHTHYDSEKPRDPLHINMLEEEQGGQETSRSSLEKNS